MVASTYWMGHTFSSGWGPYQKTPLISPVWNGKIGGWTTRVPVKIRLGGGRCIWNFFSEGAASSCSGQGESRAVSPPCIHNDRRSDSVYIANILWVYRAESKSGIWGDGQKGCGIAPAWRGAGRLGHRFSRMTPGYPDPTGTRSSGREIHLPWSSPGSGEDDDVATRKCRPPSHRQFPSLTLEQPAEPPQPSSWSQRLLQRTPSLSGFEPVSLSTNQKHTIFLSSFQKKTFNLE